MHLLRSPWLRAPRRDSPRAALSSGSFDRHAPLFRLDVPNLTPSLQNDVFPGPGGRGFFVFFAIGRFISGISACCSNRLSQLAACLLLSRFAAGLAGQAPQSACRDDSWAAGGYGL